jgi:hypothetical protein
MERAWGSSIEQHERQMPGWSRQPAQTLDLRLLARLIQQAPEAATCARLRAVPNQHLPDLRFRG